MGLALADLGVRRLSILDQDRARAEGLAGKIASLSETETRAVADPDEAGRLDGLVNATPVGMAKRPGMAVPPETLHAGMWVADIVYFPLETELLAAARRVGCQTLSGEGMAVFQAVRAFELFTGLAPDSDRMAETFRRLGA